MFEKRVDISPPESSLINSGSDLDRVKMDGNSSVVMILFSLKVGDLIDSEIMQIMPYSFAKELASNLLEQHNKPATPVAKPPVSNEPRNNQQIPQPLPAPMQNMGQQPQQMPQYQQNPYTEQMNQMREPYGQQPGFGIPQYQAPQQHAFAQNPVNVQQVQFQSFDDGLAEFDRNNIGLLMDVPLQIAVELGRTTKKIREILEFGQGSIIELDKLAGEPVDILVNGKTIAKGEVVVIDESFGVRITDIIHPSKRL
jgi:flagellar motor switch protein FliN/FliY